MDGWIDVVSLDGICLRLSINRTSSIQRAASSLSEKVRVHVHFAKHRRRSENQIDSEKNIPGSNKYPTSPQ
jgi:hypothetical protein